MSVPFSNTHLRVPQGFGTLLEGLTREVLRDQPEDIPKYAAQYFDTLLKQREESGIDPAEWAAKLEDRFYNNHSFKATRVPNRPKPGPEKDTTTDVTSSKKKSCASQSEDELSHSADSNVSTTQLDIAEEVNLTESTEEEEKHIMSLGRRLSEEESVNRFPGADVQSDDLSGTEEERDPTISKLDQVDRESNGNESNTLADQYIPQSELESTDVLSFSGVSNVDVCAQELGMAEDAEDHKQDAAVDYEKILHSEEEETTEVEEPVEVFPYSGLADVDVCATELGGAERKMDGATAEIDAYAVEEESLKLQPVKALVQSSLSQSETEDQAEITKQDEGTENEAFSDVIHEGLAHTEGSFYSIDVTKEDSLVKISFEDEVTAVATHQIISDNQGDEYKMEGTEMKVYSEWEEMRSHHEASEIMKGKVDRNESNLNHTDDDEEGEGVKDISSSHQPTIESDEADSENETDHKNGDKTKISKGELHQGQNQDFEKEANFNNSDFGEDKEDIHTEGYSEMKGEEINDHDAENISSQVIQSSMSAVPMETESETFEASAQHLPEGNDESQRKPAESQSEDTMEEKEVTAKGGEELLGEGTADPEIQEKSDTTREEESISPTHSADETVSDHQEEQRPHGCETTESKGKSSDKQEECSRPQEEEDIMDIPLDDPEANRAAAKIQAGFRGHMTRKKMKPEDKAEGEEVSSTGDVLNGSQGDPETGGSGAVERDDTSVPEQ